MTIQSFHVGQLPSGVGDSFVPLVPMTSSQSTNPSISGIPTTQSSLRAEVIEAEDDLPGAAFSAAANAKVLVSQFAMHFDKAARERLFAAIDRIHDVEEWEPGDQPLNLLSFRTFLRAILLLRPAKWPSLGLTYNGELFGIWGAGKDRLTLEFHTSDDIKWILSCQGKNGKTVHCAGMADLNELMNFLAPYVPSHWFDAVREYS